MPDVKIGDSRIAYGYSDGKLKIYSIRTPSNKRGNGSARLAMQEFLKQADKDGLDVYLDSSPLDNKTNGNMLTQFYKSLGFKETGKKINSAGDPEMVRKSRVKTNESNDYKLKSGDYVIAHNPNTMMQIQSVKNRKDGSFMGYMVKYYDPIKGKFISDVEFHSAEGLEKIDLMKPKFKNKDKVSRIGDDNIAIITKTYFDYDKVGFVYRIKYENSNLSGLNGDVEEDEIKGSSLNESIQVVAKDFIRHHGKNPAGIGSWIFGIGSRDSDKWFEYKGKYADGKKKAILKAEEAEVSKVFVMEKVSAENIDLRFNLTDADGKGYRISIIDDDKEIRVTKSLTETGAIGVAKKIIFEILQEKVNFPVNDGKIVSNVKDMVSSFKRRYLKEDEDPNIGRKWKNRNGDEIEVEFFKDGKYFTLVNGKPFGGEIIPADQLENTIYLDTQGYKFAQQVAARLDAEEKAEQDAIDAKAAKYSSIGGTALQKGRIIKALDKQVNYKGKVTTIKDLIDAKIADGWVLEDDIPGRFILTLPGSDVGLTQNTLGKIGIDYARQVLGQTNENITEAEELDERDYHDSNIWYHGSPSGKFVGAKNGLHVGTKLAATQALESRIGVPAEGEWDGTREYGKTLLAGKESLDRIEKDRGYYVTTGFNCCSDYLPNEDYYPTDRKDRAAYSDGTLINFSDRPKIFQVKINVPMSNTPQNPMRDFKANGYMQANIKKGTAKRGYYYINDGEDEGSISVVLPNNNSVTLVNESKIHQEKDTIFSIKKGDVEQATEPYTEEEGSTFESNGNFYDMNTILDLSRDIEDIEEFDVSTLEWVLDYDKARLDDLKTAEERVDSADTSVPILIYLDQTQPENEEWVVVDGIHRLAKAIINNDKTIPAKILTDEIMDRAFIPQEDESILEGKTYTQRAPYKSVKIKDIYGNVFYRVHDKSKTFMGVELSKSDADILVKTLNSISEIELNEATKSFEIKFKTVDGENTTEGVKTIIAPDAGKARSRFLEDNTEMKGLQVLSVNEVR